jgi:hypothetical protein
MEPKVVFWNRNRVLMTAYIYQTTEFTNASQVYSTDGSLYFTKLQTY